MPNLLPNTQYDDPLLVTVTPGNVRMICYGVQRSASSYVWQVTCDVFGGSGIIKTHNYLPASNTVPTLCTYRDFRDCLVSAWRRRHPTWPRLQRPEMRRLCENWQINVIAHLDRYREHLPADRFLRYEDLVVDPTVIRRTLETMCDVDEQVWQRSLVEHHITRNRALSLQETGEAGTLGASLLIMPNHVHEGAVGTWRKFVNDSDAKLLTELLSPALERWGYEP